MLASFLFFPPNVTMIIIYNYLYRTLFSLLFPPVGSIQAFCSKTRSSLRCRAHNLPEKQNGKSRFLDSHKSLSNILVYFFLFSQDYTQESCVFGHRLKINPQVFRHLTHNLTETCKMSLIWLLFTQVISLRSRLPLVCFDKTNITSTSTKQVTKKFDLIKLDYKIWAENIRFIFLSLTLSSRHSQITKSYSNFNIM